MIAGILLAAGRSERMGQPKLVMPWRDGVPLVVHMLKTLWQGGVGEIVVVTGGHREAVEAALEGLGVSMAFNAEHARGEMLSSIKVGLRVLLSSQEQAVAVSPSDLPLLSAHTVARLIQAWREHPQAIVAPSLEDRRGHPIILPHEYWVEVLSLGDQHSLRTFLRRREENIHYVQVDDLGILRDVDTQGQFRSARQQSEQ